VYVRLSVCLSHSSAAAAGGAFAAVGPGDIDRLLHGGRRNSTAQHGPQQQMRAVPIFS